MKLTKEQKDKMTKKTDFVDTNNTIRDLITAIELGANIGLRGPTGTGKTHLIRSLAQQAGKELVILNMTVNTSVDEVKGKWVVKRDHTGQPSIEWITGIVAEALQKGHWLLVEEFNFMNEEIASVFYSIMDERKELIQDEHEKEILKAHPEFIMFLTGNWDYKGTIRPNPALMNRVHCWFDIDYLPQTKEAKLLTDKTGIDPEIAKKMTKFSEGIRKITEEEGLDDLSTRAIEWWATFTKTGMDALESAEITVIPLLAQKTEEKKKIRDLVKLHFGKA